MALCPSPISGPVITGIGLCAGVGGLELGLRLALEHCGAQFQSICHVEREAAAAASLVASMEAGWFHPAPVWSDLGTFDGRRWRGQADIVTSGDPCQPNSVAGKGAGADDDRFLIDQVVRIYKECGARRLLRENVTGNADGQLAAIIPPLEEMGCRIAAGIFSAGGAGASHQRERLFILAERMDNSSSERLPARRDHHTGDDRQQLDPTSQFYGKMADTARERPGETGRDQPGSAQWIAGAGPELANGDSGGFRQGEHQNAGRLSERPDSRGLSPIFAPGPGDDRWPDIITRAPWIAPAIAKTENAAESQLCGMADGVAYRIERLRAGGNGVFPMAAAVAFLSLSTLLAESDQNGLLWAGEHV